jgi:sulfur carrier protein ThiS
MIRVKVAAARKWQEIKYKSGMKVADVLEMLKYHPASVAVINLNGLPVKEDAKLKDGDELVVVPTVGGGSADNFLTDAAHGNPVEW